MLMLKHKHFILYVVLPDENHSLYPKHQRGKKAKQNLNHVFIFVSLPFLAPVTVLGRYSADTLD